MVTLVASPSLARALRTRWYITIPGILLSLGLAAGAAVLIPPPFASNSTVVLIPAPAKGGNSLLSSSSGLSTSAEIIVQAMSDPQIEKDLGLVRGRDTVTVVNGNANSSGKITESAGPFISVTAESSSATRATALAQQATAKVQQKLAELQQSVKVKKQQSMSLSPVVSPTPGKLVVAMLLRTVGLATLFGCVLTLGAVLLVDRRLRRRVSFATQHSAGERVTAPTALRPQINGALQRLDKFDGADRVMNGQSSDPAGEIGRKAPAGR